MIWGVVSLVMLFWFLFEWPKYIENLEAEESSPDLPFECLESKEGPLVLP